MRGGPVFYSGQRFKILRTVLAQRAGKVGRKYVSLIHITADTADKALFLRRSGCKRPKRLNIVLAQRTDKIGGQRLSLVHIAADFADESGLLLSGRLRLRLNVGKVIGICRGSLGRKHARLGHLGYKERVRAVVFLIDNAAGEKRRRMLRQNTQAVGSALLGDGRKFIRTASRLEAEILKHGEGC